MQTPGCAYNLQTAEEMLKHLETGNHAGLGVMGGQLRSNGAEYYLRVYDGNSESRNVTRPEALALIQDAIDYVTVHQLVDA